MKKYVLVLLCLLTACHKHHDDGTPNLSPDKAVQVFPVQNAACTTGTVLNGTSSAIMFSWNIAANTDNYRLGIKNLLTQTIHYKSTTATQLTDTLLRNTPYSWFVVSRSKNSADTAKSDTWKFYNAGLGTIAYAPFPADITFPQLNQTVTATAGKINLLWNGSSIDNNITGYDIYLGTSAAPPLLQANITGMILNSISVTSGTTYYWRVVTKDAIGNTSDSGLSVFKVN